MLALLAMLERAGTGDLETADVTARQALAVAGRPATCSRPRTPWPTCG